MPLTFNEIQTKKYNIQYTGVWYIRLILANNVDKISLPHWNSLHIEFNIQCHYKLPEPIKNALQYGPCHKVNLNCHNYVGQNRYKVYGLDLSSLPKYSWRSIIKTIIKRQRLTHHLHVQLTLTLVTILWHRPVLMCNRVAASIASPLVRFGSRLIVTWLEGRGVEGVAPSPSVSRWGSFISSLVQRSVCPQQSTASDNPWRREPFIVTTCVLIKPLWFDCWNFVEIRTVYVFVFLVIPFPVRISGHQWFK